MILKKQLFFSTLVKNKRKAAQNHGRGATEMDEPLRIGRIDKLKP